MFLDDAVASRRHLLTSETNALRIIDGAADGVPGCFVDTYADRWLVSTQGARVPDVLSQWLRASGKCVYHKRLDQKEKESPTHFAGSPQDEPFLACENGVSFEISFQSGYSQGIFLDQRENRAEVMRRVSKGDKVLNTFSYTGVFSACGARAGATTTTLDLSQVYLDWARRNFAANELSVDDHYFCKGDTFHWLQRFARQGRTFDGIILDPPTFARDHKGKVFHIEKDYGRLAQLAHACLAPGGWILACTNYRQMSTAEFRRVLQNALPTASSFNPVPMPEEYTDDPYLKSVWVG